VRPLRIDLRGLPFHAEHHAATLSIQHLASRNSTSGGTSRPSFA
jgi:hypothetical protein